MIYLLPNVNTWPRTVGEAGPIHAVGKSNITKAANGYKLDKAVPRVVDPYMLGWASGIAPHRPMFVNEVLPSYGPLRALSWSGDPNEILVSGPNGSRPRRSVDMMSFEHKVYDVIDILYSRHAFHFNGTLPLVARAQVPGWWNADITDKTQALQFAKLARLHLLDLCAVMSLYCAIAWYQTGERDTWLATVQANGMTSNEDRLWLEGMRALFVCRFDHVDHAGAFINVAQYPHPALIDVFMLAEVPMILMWGNEKADVAWIKDVAQQNGAARGISERFCPLSQEIVEAARVSSGSGSAAGAVVTIPPRAAATGEKRSGDNTVKRTQQTAALDAETCQYWAGQRAALEVWRKDWPGDNRPNNGWAMYDLDRVCVWRHNTHTGQLKNHLVDHQERETYMTTIAAWRCKLDPSRFEWNIFPPGMLRRPAWATDNMMPVLTEVERWQQESAAYFNDNDWAVLAGNLVAPSPISVVPAQVSGVRRTAPPRPLPAGENWMVQPLVNNGHSLFKLASLQDILDRNGFQWRKDEMSAAMVVNFRRGVIVPHGQTAIEGVHYDLKWDKNARLDAAQPKLKDELTMLEWCLELLGASLLGVPSSRGHSAAQHTSITCQQVEALGLSDLQAREVIDFVARLDSLGTDIGLTKQGTTSRVRGVAPAVDGWLYASPREARSWLQIQCWNDWSVKDGYAESWAFKHNQRRVVWLPVWFLRLAGAPQSTTVALFHATIVCQVLVSSRFRTSNDLILYCVESGIHVSTPREVQPFPDALKDERERRLQTRMLYKLGYRPSGHKFSLRDYEAYKNNVRAAFRDPTIVRAAVMAGNFAWRISVEHCYPDVALDGPSDNALRLGIGQRFRKQIGPDKFVNLIDDNMGSEVELYLLGGWYNKIGSGSANPEILQTCWPHQATWELFSSAGWDARKEATYQWIRTGYHTVDQRTGGTIAQPQSSGQWKERLRNRNPVARKTAAASEFGADRFLSTRAAYEYYRTRAADQPPLA